MPERRHHPRDLEIAIMLARLKKQQADRALERVAYLSRVLDPRDVERLRSEVRPEDHLILAALRCPGVLPSETSPDDTCPSRVAQVLKSLASAARDHLQQARCSETDHLLKHADEAEHVALLLDDTDHPGGA